MTDVAAPESEAADQTLRGGSYDLLRRRLRTQVEAVLAASRSIDERRVEAFGSVQLRLTGSDRIATDLACRPRDVARIGDVLILGFNVDIELGLAQPEQVFALYAADHIDADEPTLTPLDAADSRNFLTEPAFRAEFEKLFKFYGKARFVDLRVTANQMLAVFQVGDRLDDVRALRWTIADSVDPEGDGKRTVSFADARGERDYTWPAAHDQTWSTCSREDQRAGAHPVVAVLDEVFVGFRAGRLQLRVDTGQGGSHAEIDESVEHPGQSLADVGVDFLSMDDILLIRVRLYEEAARTYVFSHRSRAGRRVDAVGVTSRTLPGGEGGQNGHHIDPEATRKRFEVLCAPRWKPKHPFVGEMRHPLSRDEPIDVPSLHDAGRIQENLR